MKGLPNIIFAFCIALALVSTLTADAKAAIARHIDVDVGAFFEIRPNPPYDSGPGVTTAYQWIPWGEDSNAGRKAFADMFGNVNWSSGISSYRFQATTPGYCVLQCKVRSVYRNMFNPNVSDDQTIIYYYNIHVKQNTPEPPPQPPTPTLPKCGENVTYTLENGVLTISGTGKMYDFDSKSISPWLKDNSAIQSIIINKGVTSIGQLAFDSCNNLKSVTIPASVTSIGRYAFDSCQNLKSIAIPSSVTNIEQGAFRNCSCLESITIPPSVTNIGDYAFSICRNLKSITMPSSVTHIGNYAFSFCDTLESVTIPSSVIGIGDYAFSFCDALESVTIPSSVTSIGYYAFRESGLQDLYYEGTQYDWNAILKGDNDIGLSNEVEIHYKEESPSTETPIPATCILVAYDNAGRFLRMEMAEISYNGASSPLSSIKWDSVRMVKMKAFIAMASTVKMKAFILDKSLKPLYVEEIQSH